MGEPEEYLLLIPGQRKAPAVAKGSDSCFAQFYHLCDEVGTLDELKLSFQERHPL